MFAKDFRAWARDALKGRWGAAVAVSLVTGLLTSSGGFTSRVELNETLSELGLSSFVSREVITVLLTVLVVMGLLALIVGGAVQLGLCTFHLNLINRREARFSNLFSQFHRLWDGFKMQFVINLFVFLWSLLLVIPGIIAAYRYAMVPYLKAEFPDLGVMDAMRESKRLMSGNKGRLFCLHMSFIGWVLLSTLTLGVGMLFVSPYMQSAETAFYMMATGRQAIWQPKESGFHPEF